MRKNKIRKLALLLWLMYGWSTIQLQAQEQAFYTVTEANIRLEGSSTLHDWTMESSQADIKATFELRNDQLQQLHSLMFTLPVKSLKSEKKKLNRKAYEALKADQYPQISFSMPDAKVVHQGQGQYRVLGTGTLTLAGVSRDVQIEANCELRGREMICTGSKRIGMTNFNIEPPKAMLGIIRADEEVTVKYTMHLRR